MTEHKFTDDEIIRAMEYWQKFDNEIDDMLRGRFKGDKMLCEQKEIVEITLNIFDLSNRQKAEIEELESEIDKQYEQAKADILGNMSDGGTSCHWCIDGHRTAAIKEFAERLKEKAFPDDSIYTLMVVEVEDIDNLVKEMTEEKTKI